MRSIQPLLTKATLALSLLIVPVVGWYAPAQAADVTNRSIELSDSGAGVTTRHQFDFDYVTAGIVGSIEFEYCTNDPFPGLPCTAPAGLDVSSATLSSQSGVTGFSVHTNTTTNRLVLTRSAAAISPVAASYRFNNVVNPSNEGSYYVRIGVFASTDGTGARTDSGGLAFAVNEKVSVAVFVPPVLLFCIGKTIPTNNCNSASGDFIDFGELSPDATSFGTTQMLAATNAVDGYTIRVTGTTMTSGNNVISGLSGQTTSILGVSQFGLNLVDNSSPNAGRNVSGSGVGFATNSFNTPNRFRFNSGDIVARSNTTSEISKFTTTYIVNIDSNQPAGVYSTTLTYTALASF